ncbi:MAG: VenA family class IV lanthipeptide [Pseudonocardiaceae bacterium]
MNSFDLVSSLQALPETNPIEVDGIQFGVTLSVLPGVAGGVGLSTPPVAVGVTDTLGAAVAGLLTVVNGLGASLGVGTC